MDHDNDFDVADELNEILTASNRPLRMQLGFPDGVASDVLLPQRIEGVEAICDGIEMRIDCLALDAHLQLDTLIGLPVQVQIVTDQGQLRSICGIVATASAGESDGGLASYQLLMRDALAILDLDVSTRVFLDQTELTVVKTVLGEARRANPGLAAMFEFELETALSLRDFPVRRQIVQYNEGTGAFVRRLLRRRGVSWFFRPGRAGEAGETAATDGPTLAPAHTMVLFQDARRLKLSSAGTIRFHRDSATEERDSITAFGAVRTLRPGRVSRHSWDYANPRGTDFMSASLASADDQGIRGNRLAATLDQYLSEAPHVRDTYEDLEGLVRQARDRSDFKATCFHAEGGVRDCTAGEYFILAGHPDIDRHPDAERQFVVLSSHITAQNNLPKKYDARVARLFARNRWHTDTADLPLAAQNWFDSSQFRFQCRLTCVRRDITFVPAWDARVDVPHAQLQSAIVGGAPGEAVYCDAQGRVKVQFTAMRAGDHAHAEGAGASGTDRDSAWVRVASSWAGTGSGMHFGALALPRPGTEVLIGFLGGDPDKPIIIGQLYNMLARPPYLGAGALPGNKYLSGIRSLEIKGSRGNQLRFDDTTGKINSQLASDHAASQLNLGYLVQPLCDGHGAFRGEGAELRSDAFVAVRGAKGVLISAAGSLDAAGGQLDREGLVGVADVLQSVAEQLAKFASLHAKDADSGMELPQLLDKLRHWTAAGAAGGSPILAAAAPAGIIVASEANLALGAVSKIDLVSAGNTDIATGGALALRGAREVSVFAHQDGMKFVAATGDMRSEAQHGDIKLSASGEITLAAGVRITLSAPDIRLVATGVQVDYGSDNISAQSKGKHLIKAASYAFAKGGAGAPIALAFPASTLATDERVILQHQSTGEPLPRRRYELTLENGRIIRGVTDELGRTSLATSNAYGKIDICIFPEDAPA
ncbi:type VI secretion system Vgr family protein [Massilia sp. MP_M2]|uniref:type VI secretion system Vgr family protein n=1 Tax=Massilia sp. MP_M2 TaxID=3071713 RepID=UPI00319DB986